MGNTWAKEYEKSPSEYMLTGKPTSACMSVWSDSLLATYKKITIYWILYWQSWSDKVYKQADLVLH